MPGRGWLARYRSHGAVRGAASRLRPRAPVRILRGQVRRGSLAGGSRLLRAQQYAAAPERPRHQHRPRGQDGDGFHRRDAVLRQADHGHRLLPLRAAAAGQGPQGLLRLPHYRRPGSHAGMRRPLQDRRGDRRRPAGPGMRQGTARHGPANPCGGICPAPDGGAGGRRRRRHAAPEDRRSRRDRAHPQEHR